MLASTRSRSPGVCFFFFFNDTATTEIYTLSLHDALPISLRPRPPGLRVAGSCRGSEEGGAALRRLRAAARLDRKSTRLNSSHLVISYAVFCLKKKKNSADRSRRFQHDSSSTRRLSHVCGA